MLEALEVDVAGGGASRALARLWLNPPRTSGRSPGLLALETFISLLTDLKSCQGEMD